MKLGEFFVQLGVDADSMSVKDFVSAIGDLDLTAAGAVAALVEVGRKLADMTGEAMRAAAGYRIFTAETGLSAQELQRWQLAAERVNVSADAVASSITAVQRNLAEIRMGRGNISPFQLLGIDPNQDAFGVMRAVREKLLTHPEIGRTQATNIIAQMGFDPQMMALLTSTNEQFDRLTRYIGIMSGSQEGSFLRLKQILVEFGQLLHFLTMSLIARFVDHLLFMYDGFQRLIEQSQAFRIAIAAIAAPLALLAAPFAALILVLDDLATYFEGGDSLTGRMMKGLSQWAGEVTKALAPLQPFIDFIDKLAHFGAGPNQIGNIFSLNPLMPIGLGAPAARVFNILVQNHGNPKEFMDAFISEMKREFGTTEAAVDNGGR